MDARAHGSIRAWCSSEQSTASLGIVPWYAECSGWHAALEVREAAVGGTIDAFFLSRVPGTEEGPGSRVYVLKCMRGDVVTWDGVKVVLRYRSALLLSCHRFEIPAGTGQSERLCVAETGERGMWVVLPNNSSC